MGGGRHHPLSTTLAVSLSVAVVGLVLVSDAAANHGAGLVLPIYGYGDYACTKQVDGVLVADQSKCVGKYKECVKQNSSSYYFCGISGAQCATADYLQCDGGACENGRCTGGLGDEVPSSTGRCMSHLGIGADGICGGVGAACDVPIEQYPGQPLNDQYDQLCLSNLCGRATGQNRCYDPVSIEGGDCRPDPERMCGNDLVPDVNPATGACTCKACPKPKLALALPPSHRARHRARRKLDERCPISFTACPLADGYECIDTSNNIEQCGGCGSAGVDCTALAGVVAVGCVDGVCEIWSCEDGYAYESRRRACVAA
ncbi:hypothetical protein JCM3774_005218 [Rhodotorula dairenensis]